MKVLVECFIPTESGPVFTLGLVKGLKNNGVDVYAILHPGTENLCDWNEILSKDHLFVLKNDLSFKDKPWNTILELLRVNRFFKNILFDFWIDTFPRRCWRIAPFLNYKESFGIDHDVIPHSSSSVIGSAEVKKTIGKLDNVIVLSKAFIEAVKKKYNKDDNHIFYMRHGAMEYPKVSNQIILDNLCKINFLYFGRIDGYKGLSILSEAYRILSEEYGDDVSLTVAGGGDFARYREQYIGLRNCVIENRYLEDDDIAYYFNVPRTVLVLPYLDATQSGVIGMGFNYRTPVIVSNTGGLREQLFDGEIGVFVEPGNSIDLYKKMKLFIEDDNLYDEQQSLMESGYFWSTWDSSVKEFLSELRCKKNIE